jgi:hypothetical protein
MKFQCYAITILLGLAPALTAQAKDGPHLFILSGQSNMTSILGRSFRESVEKVLGPDKVVVSRTGHPGQPLKNWVKDWVPPAGSEDPNVENNGHLYTKMMNTLERNLKGGKPSTVTFIWMQGEADAGKGWAAVYEKNFLSLLDQIRADLGIQKLNFVVGRINEFWLEKPDGKAMREILAKLGDAHANGAWIDTDDLNRGVNPWGGFSFEDGHYPPGGYVVMGQRFAKKACLLIDPDIKLDPDVFREQFIDSHEQIKSHAAKGTAVSCAQFLPKRSSAPGYAILTDGVFGPANHEDKAWVAIAPSEEPVEIIVDLGQLTDVKSLGINTLLSSKAKAEFKGRFIFSTSEDGVEFVVNNSRYNTIKVYNGKKFNALRAEGIEPQSVLLLTRQLRRNEPVKARKVKITIETADQPVFIDEIVVNPARE